MRVLVIGATGYVGGAVAERLLAAGHEVRGLARSAAKARSLQTRGVTPVACEILDVQALAAETENVDGIIFAASAGDWAVDQVATAAILESQARSGGVFIYTSGTGVLSDDALGEPSECIFAEDDPFNPPPVLDGRVRSERFVREAAGQGVRSIVVRPPLIYGHGGSTQVPMLIDVVRRTGAARYVGRGLNCWSVGTSTI